MTENCPNVNIFYLKLLPNFKDEHNKDYIAKQSYKGVKLILEWDLKLGKKGLRILI